MSPEQCYFYCPGDDDTPFCEVCTGDHSSSLHDREEREI